MKYATAIICTLIVCATIYAIAVMQQRPRPYTYDHSGETNALVRIDNKTGEVSRISQGAWNVIIPGESK